MRLAGAVSLWFATKIGSRELPNMDARGIDTWRQRRQTYAPQTASSSDTTQFRQMLRLGPNIKKRRQRTQMARVAPSPDRSISACPTVGFQHPVAAPAEVGQMILSLLVARRPDLPPDGLLGAPTAELLPMSRPNAFS
jgi:hypothetical protein